MAWKVYCVIFLNELMRALLNNRQCSHLASYTRFVKSKRKKKNLDRKLKTISIEGVVLAWLGDVHDSSIRIGRWLLHSQLLNTNQLPN